MLRLSLRRARTLPMCRQLVTFGAIKRAPVATAPLLRHKQQGDDAPTEKDNIVKAISSAEQARRESSFPSNLAIPGPGVPYQDEQETVNQACVWCKETGLDCYGLAAKERMRFTSVWPHLWLVFPSPTVDSMLTSFEKVKGYPAAIRQSKTRSWTLSSPTLPKSHVYG